jgi:predicted nucleic acid-binding Zn ribbon protein
MKPNILLVDESSEDEALVYQCECSECKTKFEFFINNIQDNYIKFCPNCGCKFDHIMRI